MMQFDFMEETELSSLVILVGIPFTSQRGILLKPPPVCQIRDSFKNKNLGHFRCISVELSLHTGRVFLLLAPLL